MVQIICIAKPKGTAQRATYNGHKMNKCLKFQALSLSDGLIFHIHGPVEGRRHDMTLFRTSNMAEHLQRALFLIEDSITLTGIPSTF